MRWSCFRCPLSLDGLAALEPLALALADALGLPRVRVACGLALERAAFALERLFGPNAGGAGRLDELVARRLEQPAVGGVRHRLG